VPVPVPVPVPLAEIDFDEQSMREWKTRVLLMATPDIRMQPHW
jgi:hypothetical protein